MSIFSHIQVYGSVVANRYNNQHILPLSQMSVSGECFYQPRVNVVFDEDSEQMELGIYSKIVCILLTFFKLYRCDECFSD